MEKKQIYEIIKRFITEKLENDGIENDTPLDNLEEFDSLFVVELILFAESELNIVIPEDYYGMENFETIDAIVAMLVKIM